MTTMVEKVSVAIGEKLRHALSGGPPVALHEVARAAIESMRVPTDAMRLNATSRGYSEDPSEAGYIWEAMVDAALNEKPA